MKSALIVFGKRTLLTALLLTICGLLKAQDGQVGSQFAPIDENKRIDELFETRARLMKADSSTREVDQELANLGIKFPVKVDLINYNDKINISFVLLEDYSPEVVLEKIEEIKRNYLGLEYLGIDVERHKCYMTFHKGSPEWKIRSLLEEFLYDGYYIQAVAKNN